MIRGQPCEHKFQDSQVGPCLKERKKGDTLYLSKEKCKSDFVITGVLTTISSLAPFYSSEYYTMTWTF